MSTGSLQIQVQRAKLRVGEVLHGKWRLDALLGIGGTATVYSGTHRNGKRAAIKLLHAELVSNPELVARFVREGYIANKLGHPGAVSILDDDRMEDGSIFLVMELLEGYSLERHTKKGAERLPLDRVLRIANDVLDVLAAAHRHGVIHRDIKPANIFMQTDGRIKVLDFGIARLAEPVADGALTQTGTAIGTPAFMPPEQARGRWNLIDPRTDVWAVGATMFALICGERLRRGETVQEELLAAMTAPMPPLAGRAPGVPAAVAEIVDRALAFDMDGRWPDAEAMQRAIVAVLGSGVDLAGSGRAASPVTAEPLLETHEALTTGRPFTSAPDSPSTASRGPSRTGSAWRWIAVAAAAVVVVGAGLGMRFRRSSDAAVVTQATSPSPPPAPAAVDVAPVPTNVAPGFAEAGAPSPPATGVALQPTAAPAVTATPARRAPGSTPSSPAKKPSDPFDNRF